MLLILMDPDNLEAHFLSDISGTAGKFLPAAHENIQWLVGSLIELYNVAYIQIQKFFDGDFRRA